MDLNHLLIWTVAAGCGITLLQLPWNRQGVRLGTTPAAILTVLGVLLWASPDHAGLVCGGLFLLLMMVPAWGGAALNSLLMRRQFSAAGWLARLLSLVRPGRDARRLPQVLYAMQLSQSRQPGPAIEILQGIAGKRTPLERMALVLLTRLTGDWQAFLAWAEDPENAAAVRTDHNLLETWFQGWGETGQREVMFQEYRRHQADWTRFPEFVPALIQMKLAAFCGEEQTVVQLLQGRLNDLPAELKTFWRATAAQVSGQGEQAARDFQALVQNGDAGVSRQAGRRLESSLPDLNEAPLTPDQTILLRQISLQASTSLQQDAALLFRRRRCWGTWGLVATLGIVFLCEIPGGVENFENLERMGAMLIPAPTGGEFLWRMVAAAFLHFGTLHLMMNVLGLIVLGRRIEQEWGSRRMLLTYLLAATGSIGLAPLFVEADPFQGMITLVGASGGVMGLLGGLLLQSLVHLLQGRSRLAGREFVTLLSIVLMQVTFDANTPNVSSEAHLLGMTIGMACGAVWNLLWLARRRGAQAPRQTLTSPRS